jgi:protease YdgD
MSCLIIAATLAAIMSLPASAAVFGSDDRVPLPATHRHLEKSIGLLYEQRSRSVCTAFCVGDETVATAAHCIYRTSGERPPKLSGFTFRFAGNPESKKTISESKKANSESKKERASARIMGAETENAAQFVSAGSTRLSVRPPIDASRDWALLKLSAPVCKGTALTVSRRHASELLKLSASQRVYQVAFHRDFRNWQLAYAAPCAIRRDFGGAGWTAITHDFAGAEELILHTCDTGGASSGSPLLIDGPGGPEVVGINVGTYVQSKVLMQNGEVVHRYQADMVANTGVSASAFLERTEIFSRSDILASRPKIQELQILLAKLGYYSGARDGVYGSRLRAAIENFESSEGRPETALATTSLLQRLHALSAERNETAAAPSVPSLETGSIGSQVPASSRKSR